MKKKSDSRDEVIKRMIDETEACLNCGKRLKYLADKEQRRNKGYCSMRCYLAKPPKLAYLEYEFKKPAKEVLIAQLNCTPSVECAAELLGMRKEWMYAWIKKYRIKKKVVWS